MEENKEKQTVDTAEEETLEAEVSQAAADDGKAEETAQADETASTDAQAGAVAAAVEDMKNRYLRLQADFSNFKKRTAGEKLQISEVVKMDVLQGILPVLDNFERALQVPQDKLTDDMKSFMDGYTMIYKQLVTALEKEGLKKMDAVGKPFDPMYHEAVMRMASDEFENDTVMEVLQAGYLLGDKTLRPAMVKVAFND